MGEGSTSPEDISQVVLSQRQGHSCTKQALSCFSKKAFSNYSLYWWSFESDWLGYWSAESMYHSVSWKGMNMGIERKTDPKPTKRSHVFRGEQIIFRQVKQRSLITYSSWDRWKFACWFRGCNSHHVCIAEIELHPIFRAFSERSSTWIDFEDKFSSNMRTCHLVILWTRTCCLDHTHQFHHDSINSPHPFRLVGTAIA